jgi:hypothetical protein
VTHAAGWWSVFCECSQCVLANTPRVHFVNGKPLHGVDAVRFIASRERGMSKISEIAERLRVELGMKAQRGDEPR